MIEKKVFPTKQNFLEKRVALITGAGSGIGKACSISLAKAGAYVHLIDQNKKELEIVKLKIKDKGGICDICDLDLTDEDKLKNTLSTILRTMPIHILVNNAGSGHFNKIEDYPTERWRYLIELLLTVPFLTTKLLLPRMKKEKWGRIINISSIHGLGVYPFDCAYTSAKHGIIGLSKSIAIETADFNITSNCICPGTVLTPSVERKIHESSKNTDFDRDTVIKQVILKRQPIKEIIQSQDIANYVLFLCSDIARCVTGSNIVIDGGRTLS